MTVDFATRRIVINNSINQSPLGALTSRTAPRCSTHRSFPVVGWTVDTDGIGGSTSRSTTEPSIGGLWLVAPRRFEAFPDFPALQSGFIANIDATRITEGIHNLSFA